MSSGTWSSSRSPSPTSPPPSAAPPSSVVVSSNAYHRERADLIILAVTSQARPAAGVGEAAIARWKEAGLLRPSVLKPVVATIERSLALPKLGRLAEKDRRALRDVLRAMIGE